MRRAPRRRQEGDAVDSAEVAEILYGVHPVLEALESRRRSIDRVLVAREGGTRLGRLVRSAREAGVPVSFLPRKVLARRAGPGSSHQGVIAVVSAAAYADPGAVVEAVAEGPEGTLLALDRVQDPRNLGAILRGAAAAGVGGVLLGGEGSVGLTPAVSKTAAGAVERVPVARERHLARRLESSKRMGFRVVGLDPGSGMGWDEEDLTGRIIIVAGGEEKGARRGVLEACDARVSIPMAEGMPSLNVAVAVGVVLFECVRQRRTANRGLEAGP